MAGAEERDVVLARGPQDLADLGDQRVDVVADAPLAELAEAREVATDLRRVDVRVVRQLLRGDRLLAHLLRLREHLQIAREAGGDAEREPFAHLLQGVLCVVLDRGGHRCSVYASRRRSSRSSTKKSNSSSPSSATTGMRSRYARSSASSASMSRSTSVNGISPRTRSKTARAS